MSNSAGLLVAQFLVACFLGVLFLQSGLDKVLDWKGNKSYVGGFLEKTPLKRVSTFALFCITVLEVFAGVLSAAGALSLLVTGQTAIAFAGACLAGLAILSLFLGQRLAKDYAAAAGMVPYFLATVVAVLLEGSGVR